MKTKRINKNKWVVIIIVVSIIFFLGMTVSYFYSVNKINPTLKNIYTTIPLPIVKIENGGVISSRKLFKDVSAVKKFYEAKKYTQQRVDFSTEAGKIRLQIKEKDILNKLIEDIIIQKIAESKGIKITSQEIDKAVTESLKTSDSNYEQLALNLEANYGWTIKEFKNDIVKNQLYLDRLFKWYKNNLQDSKEYARAKTIKNSILANGDNFDDIARQFSNGKSANQGGEIAWIRETDIIPEVSKALNSLKDEEISDIIISPLGMHIVMIEARRNKKDNNGKIQKEVQLKQIFIRGESFVDWIQRQKKQFKVKILMRKYKWNKDTGEVDFRDSQFRKEVQKVKMKSQGDPSL